jgi:hypothetical protein
MTACGYRSLCRTLARLHLDKVPSLAAILAENNDGLQVLCDDPFLLKPPLTDAYKGRLWLEIVRPGKSEASENALLGTGARLGLKPVASLGVRFATAASHADYRLAAAIRQGMALDQLPGRLPVTPAHHLGATWTKVQ